MGYPSQRYPDSMANLYYNFYNGAACERDIVSRFDYKRYIKQSEAPSRVDFQEFRQAMQQEIRQLWETLERMQMGALWHHRDAKDDYGIRRKDAQDDYGI
jgi:hypothetical protein